MRSFATPSISPSTPVTVFHRELISYWTDSFPQVHSFPSRLEFLIPEGVVLGTPSGDDYRAMHDDGNVTGDKPLPEVIVT